MSFATTTSPSNVFSHSAASLPREHLAAIQHIINDALALQSRTARPPPPYHNIQRQEPAWFKPRMDLFESHSASGARPLITATFELPGLRKEDVHIELLDNHMIVAGDRRQLPTATVSRAAQDEVTSDAEGAMTAAENPTMAGTKDEETHVVSRTSSWQPELREGYTVREIKRGRFKRVVPLPPGTKLEDVRAAMHDGILTVTFPGPVRPMPHSISVD